MKSDNVFQYYDTSKDDDDDEEANVQRKKNLTTTTTLHRRFNRREKNYQINETNIHDNSLTTFDFSV